MANEKKLAIAELLALIDDEKLDDVANYLFTQSRFTNDARTMSHYVQLIANIRKARPSAWDELRRRIGTIARDRVGGSTSRA